MRLDKIEYVVIAVCLWVGIYDLAQVIATVPTLAHRASPGVVGRQGRLNDRKAGALPAGMYLNYLTLTTWLTCYIPTQVTPTPQAPTDQQEHTAEERP